mgnify:CR=1 FL=1
MLIFQKCFSSSRDKKTQLIADLKENLHAVLAKNNLMLRISNFDLELILDESITNAMEHGNNWDPTKKVCVKMELYDEELILFVEGRTRRNDLRRINENFVPGKSIETKAAGVATWPFSEQGHLSIFNHKRCTSND